MRHRSHAAACAVGFLLLLGVQAPCAAALLLKPGAIKGESQRQGYQDWIDVDAFGISVSREISSDGRTMSRTIFSPLAIEGPTSIASVDLFAATFDGRPMPSVQLDIVREGGPQPLLVASWTLSDAFVTSYSTSGTSDNAQATEAYEFGAFSRIKYRYYSYGADGSPKGFREFEWDLRLATTTTTSSGTVSDFQLLTGTLVPEPGALAGIALAGFTALARRRRGA